MIIHFTPNLLQMRNKQILYFLYFIKYDMTNICQITLIIHTGGQWKAIE